MKGLSEMDKKIIEQKSQELLKKHSIDTSRFIDVLELARKEDIAVVSASLPSEDDGFILINQDDELFDTGYNKVIGINSKMAYEDKRFIIAHELGHYWLHYDKENSSVFGKQDKYLVAGRNKKHGRDDNENDVDFFAACLLMPRETFSEKYAALKVCNLSDDEISVKLANFFRVPVLSARRRIGEV